jgi:hypothetical protein
MKIFGHVVRYGAGVNVKMSFEEDMSILMAAALKKTVLETSPDAYITYPDSKSIRIIDEGLPYEQILKSVQGPPPGDGIKILQLVIREREITIVTDLPCTISEFINDLANKPVS